MEVKSCFQRIPKSQLPHKPVYCNITDCVYCKENICDDVSCNKGNSDAACYKMGNRILMEKHLELIKDREI